MTQECGAGMANSSSSVSQRLETFTCNIKILRSKREGMNTTLSVYSDPVRVLAIHSLIGRLKKYSYHKVMLL